MIRTAGIRTAAAFLLLAAGAGTATSQVQIQNNQSVISDVFADQTLDVVDVSGAMSVITPATGNTFTGSAVGVDIDVQSTQDVQANVGASALLNVTGSAGDTTIMSTAATGNSGESNVFEGGILTGTSTQTVGAVNVTASGEFAGPDVPAGDITSFTQAVANSQGYGFDAASGTVTVNQSSDALTQADDGGNVQYTPGTVIFSALAASNNVTAVGDNGSAMTVIANQTMTGDRTQASIFAGAGNAQDITAQTTATGNNLSATNNGDFTAVYVGQDNDAYVRSEVNLSSYWFGAATANAYGAGNSVYAGVNGDALIMNNTQTNTGDGIEVLASFTGDTGYDAYVSATAIGNAVSGFVCSTCGGELTVTNSQNNGAGVSAVGGVSITSSARSVTTAVSATGNAATFYATSPDN